MKPTQKKVNYTTANSYETLNNLTEKTKNVWIVFHGIGYLSRFFLKYFKGLDTEENYIIAPQAPSKYYLNNTYKHVGASWLTKEDTHSELANVLSYINAVYEAENIGDDKNIILFGFSQGVSIVSRWLASRKIAFNKLVLYAGSIPKELGEEDFDFIDYTLSEVKIIYGDADEFITEALIHTEKKKIEVLFKNNAKIKFFKGGHEVKAELLNEI